MNSDPSWPLPNIEPALLAQRLRSKLAQKLRENRIDDYQPYAKQREFHEAGLHARERLLRAGNQLGKCTTINSVISTPSGHRRMKELVEYGRPFEVLAWDGAQQVRAFASAPFRKLGWHHCYRLTMVDGQTIEAADHHRLLCGDGWRRISELLPQFGLCLPLSTEEVGQSVRGEDDQSYAERRQDYPRDCFPYCRRCGGRLQWGADSGLVSPPSLSDVPRHNHSLLLGDDHQPGHTSNLCFCSVLRASWDGLLGHGGQCVGSVIPICDTLFQQSKGGYPVHQRLAAGSISQLRSNVECVRDVAQECSYVACEDKHPLALPVPSKDGNRLVSCEYIGLNEVYDFEVACWHNYIAAGMIHHNTFSGAAEASYHATGEYPDWWQGRRIEQHNAGWIGGPSGETLRDGAQRVLLGPPNEWGTGMLRKSSIIDVTRATGVRDLADTVTVKHVQGGTSRIKFKTYDQGRQRWQAETLHWLWLDEEPEEDIYLEGLSRTNATGGFLWLTFTPLLGVSDVVMRFLREKSPDRADIVMTIEDAEHIAPAERQRIIDSYPEHEREARTRGVPILGSGRVFPFPRALLSVDPFDIPRHWARIGAIDIGWDHPTAAVKLAHDRDADVIYVMEAYRARETTVAVHAGALVPWGKALPWAWPHDAFQHDKGSGEQIAQLYRTHGMNMLHEHAQFADDRGNGVEAGLFEMVDRMQTARLKVFAHLNDWFEEFELYHRKDGKVVKERDDLLSATRYGIMMLRHAKPLGAPYDPYARGWRPRVRGSAMAA